MLSGIGHLFAHTSDTGTRKATLPPKADPTAALNGQIREDEIQLNDWVTCVSADTPKGRAEIQRLSGQISAAKEEVADVQARNAASQSSPLITPPADDLLSQAGAATYENLRSTRLGLPSDTPTQPGGLVNTWA